MVAAAQVPWIFENAADLTSSSQMNDNFNYLAAYINANASDLAATVKFTGLPSGPLSDPSGTTQIGNKRYADKRGLWRTATEQGKEIPWSFKTVSQTVATFTRQVPIANQPMTFHIMLSGYVNPGPNASRWVGILSTNYGSLGSGPTLRFSGSGNASGGYREFNANWAVTLTPTGTSPLTFNFLSIANSGISAGQQGTINCNVIIVSYLNNLPTVT